MKKLCTYPYPRVQPAPLSPLIKYAIADVLLLRAVYQTVAGVGEADVIQHHYKLNARGVLFDADLAVKLMNMEQTEARAINAAVKELTGYELEHTRSPQKVRAWLESRGIKLPSLARKLLEQFLADPEADIEGVEVLFEGDIPEPVAKVIEARLLDQPHCCSETRPGGAIGWP